MSSNASPEYRYADTPLPPHPSPHGTPEPRLSPRTPRSTTSHAARFALVGIGSTLLYTLLFMVLDTQMNHNVANVVALVVCTVLNTWVNQRFTFAAGDVSGRDAHVQSLTILAITLAITTLALWVEHHIWPDAGTLLDTVTVTGGNAVATIVRFFVFRRLFAH